MIEINGLLFYMKPTSWQTQMLVVHEMNEAKAFLI